MCVSYRTFLFERVEAAPRPATGPREQDRDPSLAAFRAPNQSDAVILASYHMRSL